MKLFYVLFAAAALAGSVLAWSWLHVVPPDAMATARYVGSHTCAECHQREYRLWRGSDHDRAMELATDETVEADFNDTTFTYQGVTSRFFRRDGRFMVHTEGPDGAYQDFEVKYTFGVRPLQQYMVELADGRIQVLRESWDVEDQEWFYVRPPDVLDERIEPGDPLHWTGIAQNWNTTCADCHSTDVRKNYDPSTDTYHTTFAEMNVSCEECHGPGSVHVELARSWSPFWDRRIGYGLTSLKVPAWRNPVGRGPVGPGAPPVGRGSPDPAAAVRRAADASAQLETCAKCHTRRYQISEGFRPGHPLLDYYEPALLSAGLYEADGQILDEVFEYGSFLQSKMHANRVQCTDCHDPHSLRLKFTGNQLCTQCHTPARYDTPAHHHHPIDSAGSQCIECHMPSRTYMEIDDRRDHSFRSPRPDLSVELGTPNACNDCHAGPEETFEWAADAVRKWYGDKRPDDPHWAPALAAGRAAEPEGEQLLLELAARRATPAIVRATAIDLLANYPSQASAKARRTALNDFDPLVRLSAVRALTGEFDVGLTSDLADRLSDPLRAVRLAAVTRLAILPLDSLSDAQRDAFDQALVELRARQELSLDHAGGRVAAAALDRRLGRTERAFEHLQAAIRQEPYMAGPRRELAALLDDEGGDPAEIRRLRSEEAELIERDARLAPDNAAIFYQLGLLRYLLGEYDAAQEALTAATQKSQQDYDYLMALAMLHERRYELSGDEEQLNAAVEALKRLHEMDPADPRARQILARLLATQRARQAP